MASKSVEHLFVPQSNVFRIPIDQVEDFYDDSREILPPSPRSSPRNDLGLVIPPFFPPTPRTVIDSEYSNCHCWTFENHGPYEYYDLFRCAAFKHEIELKAIESTKYFTVDSYVSPYIPGEDSTVSRDTITLSPTNLTEKYVSEYWRLLNDYELEISLNREHRYIKRKDKPIADFQVTFAIIFSSFLESHIPYFRGKIWFELDEDKKVFKQLVEIKCLLMFGWTVGSVFTRAAGIVYNHKISMYIHQALQNYFQIIFDYILTEIKK